MYTFAEKPQTPQTTSARSALAGRPNVGQSREVSPPLHLQRSAGNQTGRRGEATTGGIRGASLSATSARSGRDPGRMPVHSRPAGGTAGVLQAKLTINEPGDRYEQEADRVSEQVMRMESPEAMQSAPPSIQRLDARSGEKISAKHLQRACSECEKEKEEETLQREAASMDAGPATGQAQDPAEAKVSAVRGGKELSQEQRAFFEPRFGADFSRVRIHTGGTADTAARSVGAHAYTKGNDIVFRGDQYHPDTASGRQLLAHELTHVVQQGAAPRIQRKHAGGNGEREQLGSGLSIGRTGELVQRAPGDGMSPPGDCSWAKYLALLGAVESAKAITSGLGKCKGTDGCTELAMKIAAASAEVAARMARDSACFRGGDEDHQQQVEDKSNMVKNCYTFFTKKNCSQDLVEQMGAVVIMLRAAVAATVVAVALALVVVLIIAIIALIKLIIAAIAAAAAGAIAAGAIGATAAAVIALLVLIQDEIA